MIAAPGCGFCCDENPRQQLDEILGILYPASADRGLSTGSSGTP